MNTIFVILPDLAAGGAERVVITYARLLKKQGMNVEFINLGRNEGDMQTWIEPEFRMTSFGHNRVLSAVTTLCKFMKSHPNSIYFGSREHVNLVGLLAAKITGSKMVVRIPNMPRNNLTKGLSGVKLKIIKTINKWLLPTAERIIAQNEEMRLQLLDFYSLKEEKVIYINNPVDEEYIHGSAKDAIDPFDSNEINFLNVCNIAYSKGIDILVKSWRIVKEKIPNAHMYIIGRNNSDYAQDIINQASQESDFTFLGFKSNPYPYMKYCDAFVLPSRMEGFPNVVLEAMCFNRPIASTTCVNVIKEIIQEGKNGYYCDIEDSDALANCMIEAVKLKNISYSYNLFDINKLITVFS